MFFCTFQWILPRVRLLAASNFLIFRNWDFSKLHVFKCRLQFWETETFLRLNKNCQDQDFFETLADLWFQFCYLLAHKTPVDKCSNMIMITLLLSVSLTRATKVPDNLNHYEYVLSFSFCPGILLLFTNVDFKSRLETIWLIKYLISLIAKRVWLKGVSFLFEIQLSENWSYLNGFSFTIGNKRKKILFENQICFNNESKTKSNELCLVECQWKKQTLFTASVPAPSGLKLTLLRASRFLCVFVWWWKELDKSSSE